MSDRLSRTAPRIMLTTLLLLGVLFASGAPLVAQQGARPPAPGPTIPPPTTGHAVLHRLLGEWSARMEVSATAGAKPRKSRALETVRTCCAGMFILTELRGKSKKSTDGGRGILGYDSARGRYILSWADARSTSLAIGGGEYNEENDTLTFYYERPDGNGGSQLVRDLFAWEKPDRRSRTISVVDDDGSTRPLMVIQYRRK